MSFGLGAVIVTAVGYGLNACVRRLYYKTAPVDLQLRVMWLPGQGASNTIKWRERTERERERERKEEDGRRWNKEEEGGRRKMEETEGVISF